MEIFLSEFLTSATEVKNCEGLSKIELPDNIVAIFQKRTTVDSIPETIEYHHFKIDFYENNSEYYYCVSDKLPPVNFKQSIISVKKFKWANGKYYINFKNLQKGINFVNLRQKNRNNDATNVSLTISQQQQIKDLQQQIEDLQQQIEDKKAQIKSVKNSAKSNPKISVKGDINSMTTEEKVILQQQLDELQELLTGSK